MSAYGASQNACSHRTSAAADAARMGTSRGVDEVLCTFSRGVDRNDEKERMGRGGRDEEGRYAVLRSLERSKMWRSRVERYTAAGRMESTEEPIFEVFTAQKGSAPSSSKAV